MTSKSSPAKDAPEEATIEPGPDIPAMEPASLNVEVDADGPGPGVYEYTYPLDCVYAHVPLTCRAADATSGIAATVFDWPFGPPDDGRWVKTRKKPNQAADNAGPLTSEE